MSINPFEYVNSQDSSKRKSGMFFEENPADKSLVQETQRYGEHTILGDPTLEENSGATT